MPTDSSTGVSPFWDAIDDIIRAQGIFSDGVFSIESDRNDISNVTLHGVPIKLSFQINGNLYFQKLGDDTVIVNFGSGVGSGRN